MLGPQPRFVRSRRRCCAMNEQQATSVGTPISPLIQPCRSTRFGGRQQGLNRPRGKGNMAFSPEYRTYPRASAATTAAVLDAGLRAYMLRVYNWMTSGLLLTGLVAFAIAHTGLIDAFYPMVQTPVGMVRHASGLAMLSVF